jgi:hypothetical protein
MLLRHVKARSQLIKEDCACRQAQGVSMGKVRTGNRDSSLSVELIER